MPKTKAMIQSEQSQKLADRKFNENIRKRKTHAKKVEQYIYQIYINISDEECMRAVLISDLARSSLEKYLESINDTEYLELYQASSRILTTIHTSTAKFLAFEALFKQFIWPRNDPNIQNASRLSKEIRASCLSAMETDVTDSQYIFSINKICDRLKSAAVSILFEYYFPSYLNSKYYVMWRQLESAHAIATSASDLMYGTGSNRNALTVREPSNKLSSLFNKSRMTKYVSSSSKTAAKIIRESLSKSRSHKTTGWSDFTTVDDTPLESDDEDSIKKSSILSPPMQKAKLSNSFCLANDRRAHNIRLRSENDLSVRAFANVEINALDKLLNGENWMAVLLAAVEGLSIGFCLCSVSSILTSIKISKPIEGSPTMLVNSLDILFANQSFESMIGYNRRSLLGSSIIDVLCHGCKGTPEATLISLAAQSGKQQSVVLQTEKADGKLLSNLTTVKPIFDEDNLLAYIMVMCVDVTNVYDEVLKLRILQSELIMGQLPSEVMAVDID